MWLEGGLAIIISAQVLEQLVHGGSESLVLRVSVELLAQELELVNDAVGVVLVAVAEEEVAVVVQAVPLLGRLVLENVALLLKALAEELIGILEEALELWVAIGIGVDLVDGVDEVVERGAIGKAFQESLEVCQRGPTCFK